MSFKPLRVANASAAVKFLEKSGHSHVKVGWTDLDGVIRGKYIGKEKFLSSLDKGFGFCDVILGWDINDMPYPKDAGVTYTGWHTGFPDQTVKIAAETMRIIPFENGLPFFLCDLADDSFCPRGILKRVLKTAQDMGFALKAGFEYEFFVFNETPASLREKNYRNLTPFTPGNFCYSVLRNSTYSGFYHEILDMCEKMDMPLEGLHTETGPGVLEGAIQVADGLEAADRAALFKTFMKVLAQKNDKIATFMAKWSNQQAGQGGHIHMSLWSAQGERPLFHDASENHAMSRTMQQFLAGQQKYMPEMLALVAQTVNAYTRMVPGAWAPTSATWGVENRTCSIRAIPGSEKSQRIEYRIAGADANPYLSLAVAVITGLWGIEEGLELPPPSSGNAYEVRPTPQTKLAETLTEAASRLRTSRRAKEFLGEDFVHHFAASREWEDREFRKTITDWELNRYFEIV